MVQVRAVTTSRRPARRKAVTVAKGKKLPAARVTQLRKRPGASNLGKYKNVPSGQFAGTTSGTYPIPTLAKAKSALKLAHNDPNPSRVKQRVYAKYPQLRPNKRK